MGDFPGGPVVMIPGLQHKEPGFNPWSGIPRSHMLQLRSGAAKLIN